MATTYPIGVIRAASILQDVDLNIDVATSGSTGANNWLFELLKNNTTVMASRQTDAAEVAANTAYPLTLSGTQSNLRVAAGDTLQLRVTRTGSPTDLSTARKSGSYRFTKLFD